ncbi:MAG TPA: IPT/TIG domain-containing protein [Candidatus Dormibacteraeota bacterium]|nr:IPT/TIG domain-containing protein [Candidatus Dormibacteraeota bacterium]
MGEIMRWRLTRAAQRRIPAPETLVYLGGGSYRLNASTLKNIQSLQKGPDLSAAFASYSQVLSDTSALRQHLTVGTQFSSPVIQAFLALLQLDLWLASTQNRPSVAALSSEVNGLLGSYLNTSTWKTVHTILSELYYAALTLSAYGVNFSLTEVLGWLTRLLLVVALVDTLEQPVTPIQTPDDIYAALRWRTLVLPDLIALLLLTIRLLVRKAVLVRKPGFADLYITREEWDHYEEAEIASIENILGGELKSRVHILVNQTQITTTTDTTTTSVKEQDSTTTDLSQLQQQSTSDISIAAHIDGQVDTSGQYGPTQVNTHLGGSLDYSNATTSSRATTQSHETVSRAVSKIVQSTRQVRTVSTLTRATDKEKHEFDNTKQTDPVVGVYQWVDQIQNVELDRYPHRFLMEFEIPEPAAWTRWLHLNDLARNMINKPPVPLTLSGLSTAPPLMPSDINAGNYPLLVSRYNAAGVSPPPMQLVVAENVTYPAPQQSATSQSFQADSNINVPSGYYAACGTVSIMEFTQTSYTPPSPAGLNIALGAGRPQQITSQPNIERLTTWQLPVGPISQGTVPIAIFAAQLEGFSINVEVTCLPLDQTYNQWQNNTYDLIVAAYNAQLQAFNDEKAGLTIQQTNLVDANSPAQNAQVINQELKRQVIEMLIGTPFSGLSAINWDPNGVNPPTTSLSKAVSVAPEVQFLEQAFEWETLSYICYPYYWADSSRWKDLAIIEGNDSNFADFLRAGSARVVLAARPGFEDQVNIYVSYGILWGGGPVPAPGDENYLSIADEIKAQQQRPLDVTVIDAWQVRLPTTLIWLKNKKAGLPSNPSPTIVVITRVYPAAGAVGALVTITGSNFGSVQGSSAVMFNGVPAVPLAANWTPYSITVPVPVGATSGDIVVTINGIDSNGVRFTVT